MCLSAFMPNFTSPFGYPTWKKVCILKYTASSGGISTWGESKSPVPWNGSSGGLNNLEVSAEEVLGNQFETLSFL